MFKVGGKYQVQTILRDYESISVTVLAWDPPLLKCAVVDEAEVQIFNTHSAGFLRAWEETNEDEE